MLSKVFDRKINISFDNSLSSTKPLCIVDCFSVDKTVERNAHRFFF
jgi:hypothetical protein